MPKAQYMPFRPNEERTKYGQISASNSWPIDVLEEGVYVEIAEKLNVVISINFNVLQSLFQPTVKLPLPH